jgi:5-formyltetrahydrofolate cyclo-ligase
MVKARLRSIVRDQIRFLDDAYIFESNLRIFEAVCRLPEYRSADRIFLYCSMEREVDTAAIRAHAEKEGKLVAFPRVFGGGKMDFAIVDGLPEQFFGIPQPSSELPAIVPGEGDLILVPALCYDEDGFRLGQGGGYYDRFLAGCPAVTAGLGRGRLLVRRLPRQIHDVPVSILITEEITTRLPKEPRGE